MTLALHGAVSTIGPSTHSIPSSDGGSGSSLVDSIRLQGTKLRDRGETKIADSLYRESLHLAEMIGSDRGKAHALNCMGSISQRRGDLKEATSHFENALRLAKPSKEPRLVAMLQQNLGIIADIRGNVAAAIAHYHAALETADRFDDASGDLRVLNNLGYLYARQNQPNDARALYAKALEMARDSGDLLSEGIIEENRAELALIERDIPAAYPAIERALSIADEREDSLRYASALRLLAECRRRTGDLPGAIERAILETLEHAITLAGTSEDALLSAELLFRLGCARWESGDESMGRQEIATSLLGFERIAARPWIAKVRKHLADGGHAGV